MRTITVQLPEDVAARVEASEVNAEQLNSFLVSAVNAWLVRHQKNASAAPKMVKRAWKDAFRESAVPFADRLIDENRALFEELARL